LLTGRRLWSRHFEPPVAGQQDRSGSDAWLWVQDGYVISVDKFGQLEVSQAGSGDRVLWRRKRPARRWFAVRARGQYVVAVDERLEKADIFRLADGRYLGACEFKQSADRGRKVNITLFEDVICGPASPNDVVAIELATPGVERWRVSTDSDLSQLFKPAGDLLAVADRAGRVQLVDPRTGNRQMQVMQVDACADGVTDGTVEGGIFYVCGLKRRASGAGGDGDQQRWGIAAIRTSDGKVLWQQDDFGARAHLNQAVLESCSNAIPVAVLLPSGESRQFQSGVGRVGTTGRVELSVVDKLTGKMIGTKVSASLDADAGAWRILNMAVRPGQIEVTAGAALVRFPFKHEGPATTQPAESSEAPGLEQTPAGIDSGKPGTRGGAR
jgi:hypothetical protein